MNFLFKLYYSWVYNKREKGADATVIVLSSMLTFNLHMVLMYFSSFFYEVKKIPIPLVVILFVVLNIVTRWFINKVYVKEERYKFIEFKKDRTLYGVGGALFSIFTLIVYPIGSYLIFQGFV